MAKRNDKGSIVKTSANKWKATVTVGYDDEGGQKRKSKTFAKKADALTWAEDAMRLYGSIDITSAELTFAKLCERWLMEKEKQVKSSTLKNYVVSIEKAIPIIGRQRVDKLKYCDFQDIFDDMANKGNERSYISHFRNVLKIVMEYAVLNDLITVNPVKRTKIQKKAETTGKRIIDSFTVEEQQAITANYKKIPFGDVVYLMLNTGLRGQEVCALDMNSIKCEDGQHLLVVDKAMCQDNNGWHIDSTKSKTSNRVLPITAELSNIIRERLIQSPNFNGKRFFLWGAGKDGAISAASFYNRYKDFFTKLNESLPDDSKVRTLSPHCCRHTYATNLARNNVPPYIAMKLLGHSEISMTMNVYTNANKDDTIKELKKAGMI